MLSTRRMQGNDVPWPHDVRIALPPSHEHGDRSYPVLWVTDASLSFPLVVGTHGFYPMSKWVNAGPGGTRMEARSNEMPTGGGADALLSFLVDELRPRLATEFRFDDGHGLVGFSGGGHFVGFALLSRPAAFGRCLASSRALSGCEDLLFTLEADYATTHKDLAAKVFLGADEAELTDPYLAAADIVGSMTRMSQLLRPRNYPSLEFTFRLYPRQTHGSALSYALNEGLRTLPGTGSGAPPGDPCIPSALPSLTPA
ncbi:alpha/beta hydrolase [Streptomyces humi]|uniref:alpha/beta hydrolase n=1 Tax=Streptomyces humi TaxID=1428620 RepID=UPI001F0A5047|nr:alpha/beta hydrolase-fold protein [Streptomyces humi]